MSRRVLIADDSAVARVAVARRLRANGIVVEERDSVASVSSVDVEGLACALLDLDLGDGLGTEIAERLRARKSRLPIAFFSSTSSPEVLAQAAAFGPVFAKPDELDQAVDWVRKNS